jgi:putative ABC transport system substrate-binding protein
MRRREFITGAGSALAWSSAIQAQQQAPTVGFLFVGAPEKSGHLAEAFRLGLAEKGYVERKNLTIEYRWADQYDQLPLLAADQESRHSSLFRCREGWQRRMRRDRYP